MAGPSIKFVCGGGGKILAAKGISLKPVNLPSETGKLVIAEAKQGEIRVKIDLKAHTTTLTVAKKRKPNPKLAKLAIRIPIGVRLFKIDPGFKGFQAFFHETGDGYNTLPYHLLPGQDMQTTNPQTVQEVILITSHVPPRRDPAILHDTDFDEFVELKSLEEFKTRLAQNGLDDLGLAD